jgi:hypothetical protein
MRIVGFTLLVLGVLPLVALCFGYWVWARHMYTIGLSVKVKWTAVLTLLGVVDLALLAAGLYLLHKARISN